MSKKETTEGYAVDFAAFHPTPRGTFQYKGKAHKAWSALQLGQSAFARIDTVGPRLKDCKSIAEQYDVIVEAIVLLVPTAPGAELREEPFDALMSALSSLISEGKAARPTKAGRKMSGSRRTTAQ